MTGVINKTPSAAGRALKKDRIIQRNLGPLGPRCALNK